MNHPIRRLIGAVMLLLAAAMASAAAEDGPATDSPRIALVIGIGAYRTAPLPSAPNDAGLVAQTLAAAGFDVTGARDLDGASLRRAVRDFLTKASAGGPRGIALVYLAGHAVQFEGENYFAPADARLTDPAGLPIEALRIADLTRALAATNLGAKLVVVDGAHADPRATGPLAEGLALVEPERGSLLAFNAAPGTVAPVDPGPYGPYALVLVRTMKQGGIPVDEIFDRVRVATTTRTGGAVVPWSGSKLLESFTFFDRADNAPAMGSAQVPFSSLRTRPLRDFSPEQAYDVAIARDTLAAYQDYLTVFPDHALARRIRAILAIRREALFWRDVGKANSPPAYWTYLLRYPQGPHQADARARLIRLSVDGPPPPNFMPLAFDVPPPPDDERPYIGRHAVFADPDLPPPPPPPLFLLPPDGDDAPPPPPPPSAGPRLLPLPLALAIPFVRSIIAPGLIVPPHGITGNYREPRPFMAGPTKDGLVPRHDELPPGQDHRQIDPVAAPAVPVHVPPAPLQPTVPSLKGPEAPRPKDKPAPPPAALPLPSLPAASRLPQDAGPTQAPVVAKPHPPAPATVPAGSLPAVPGLKEPQVPKPKQKSVALPAALPLPSLPATSKLAPQPRPEGGPAQAPAMAKPHPPAPAIPSPVVAPKPSSGERKKQVAPERPNEDVVPHAPGGKVHPNGRPDCGHAGQPPCA